MTKPIARSSLPSTLYISGIGLSLLVSGIASPIPTRAATLPYPLIDAVAGGISLPTLPETTDLTPLSRIAPGAYPDGTGDSPSGLERPNARDLSNRLSVPENTRADAAPLSNLAVAMFQLVASHEIARSPTDPADSFDIPLPPGDPMRSTSGRNSIALSRSKYVDGSDIDVPRQQVNDVTPAFDASIVYGSSSARQDALRAHEGGRLLLTQDGALPIIGRRASAGDVRADENPNLQSLHALFAREHNRIADEIGASCPDCSDQDLFEGAAVMTQNLLHRIYYDEMLPTFLGTQDLSSLVPQGADLPTAPLAINEATAAALRVGHTQVPDTILLGGPDGPARDVDLSLCFFDTRCLGDAGMVELLDGAAQQAAEPIDLVVADALRNTQLPAPGRPPIDLFATNIQRGRDHGLPSYMAVRNALGLAPAPIETLLPGTVLDAYGEAGGIDLLIGLFSETRGEDDYLGETGKAIWALQFDNLEETVFGFEDPLTQATLEDWLDDQSMAALLERDLGLDRRRWGESPFIASAPAAVPLPPAMLFLLSGLGTVGAVCRGYRHPWKRLRSQRGNEADRQKIA